MRALSLFSGIGGIDLALEDYATTVGYVEINKYAQSVLLSRMVDGSINTAPIHRDITRLDGRKLRGHVELIFGGFPCQDISVAGNGAGLDGKRSGLFFEICRLIKEIKPVFIFLENVPAIRTRGLDVVLKELTALGYDCRWTVVSASSVGACHKRDRWFLLAHANGLRLRQQHESELNKQKIGIDAIGIKGNATNTNSKRLEGFRSSIRDGKKLTEPCSFGGWKSEPTTRGRDHGVQFRMERLKCLGNSVVPLQVKKAFERLIGI
jgi:DNA (cytosine-5)-methyltransferase 1